MISILEVIVAAIQDKLNIGRVNATLLVCIPMGIVSTLLFGTATGLPVLDVMDKFVNTYGIVAVNFVYVAAIIIGGRLPELRRRPERLVLHPRRRLVDGLRRVYRRDARLYAVSGHRRIVGKKLRRLSGWFPQYFRLGDVGGVNHVRAAAVAAALETRSGF